MPEEELGAEMAPGVGLAGHVLREGKSLRLDRYGDLDQPTLPELVNHSVIGMPIRWGDKMIGFFGLGNESPNRFSERDAETLELFAQYAAIAIHNANLFEASHHALDEMRLLYETSQRIGLSAGVDEVIDAYLEHVAAAGQYVCNIVLYEFDSSGERVTLRVKGRWTPKTGLLRLDERLPYSRDNLDSILDAGQTITIADVRSDPRVPASLREAQEASGRWALTMIPLMVRRRRIGLVVLSHPGVHKWNEDALRPYRATAAQLAIAIDHRTQQTLVSERGQQLAVLQERQRLARELHDSVTQLIFSTTLIAQSIEPAWRRDPLEGKQRVDRLLELSQTALREMRSLLFELRPGEMTTNKTIPAALTGSERIHHYGMLGALRLLAEDFSHDGIKVRVEMHGSGSKFFETESTGGVGHEAALKESVYRIIQESLNNATRHSQARHVTVQIRNTSSGSLCFSVIDDGIGFHPGLSDAVDAPQGSGLGMKTMRERAEAMGGNLSVISTPGQGTVVEVIVPFKESNV
jgi:signal transduction histidine kinase